MQRFTLLRIAKTPDGVIGRMGSWVTLEEEDQENRRNISAIPTGTYTCRRRMYHGGGYETFEVCDVPNRSHILIHIGNTEEDTAGCILLGRTFGSLWVTDEDTDQRRAKLAVLQSGAAFRSFMAAMHGVEEFELTIRDYEPGGDT